MDWLRRNWPDLLIGVALVAVIAGIVATLLTGGSFLTVGETRSADTPPAQEDVASTPDPGADEEEGAGVDDGEDDGPRVAVLPPSDEAPPEPAETPEEAGVASVEPEEPDTDPAPADDGGEADEAPPASGSVEPLDPDEGDDTDAADGDAPPEAADAPADDEVAADSEPSASELPTDPFRVSVGAFSSRGNAESQAERFREAGYPVFIGAQDALSLVLVGPYQQRERADEVAARIDAAYDDVEPVIYRYEADDAAPAGSAGNQVAAAPEEADAAAPADAAANDAAASGEAVTLQVGAYATPDSAQPLIERLESLGFAVTRQRDGGLIRILLGPFQGEALEDARTTLNAAGIDHFAR